MKKIGLVGGTGPESTLMYYKELNSRIDSLTNGKAMPDIVIESVNFRRVWSYVTDGKHDMLVDYLAEKIDNLIKSGAEVVSLTAVTMHIVFDELQKNVPFRSSAFRRRSAKKRLPAISKKSRSLAPFSRWNRII